MLNVFRPFLFLLLFSFAAAAQTMPEPSPTPGSRQGPRPATVLESERFKRIRAMEVMMPKAQAAHHPLLDPKTGIYRRPGKAELAALPVDAELLRKYGEFLKGANTGIVKLNGESSCISDTEVIVASEKCAPFVMPGAGASFSFRTESYRLAHLADLILFNGVFQTGGILQHGMMVDAGDVPIEAASLDAKGMKFLINLRPVEDGDQFMAFETASSVGIESDGYLYRMGQRANLNSTYFLRSIAYRGTYPRVIQGVQYDEMDFDRRRDVLLAFRVVDRDTAGNITIVWKILRDEDAPKLKIRKNN